MNHDNITAFLAKLQTDPVLADKVSRATAGALAEIAAQEGLPFTSEEFLENQSVSLSDAELATVSGGLGESGSQYITTIFGHRMPVQIRKY